METFLTTKEVATHMRVCQTTVLRLAKAGKLSAMKYSSRDYRFALSDVEALTGKNVVVSCDSLPKFAVPIKSPPAWKTDFEVYRAETVAAISELVKDEAWLRKMEQYHPRSNVLLSIEKSMNTFWATEEGWDNKKKSKSDKINWKSTIARTLQYSLVPKTAPYSGGGY